MNRREFIAKGGMGLAGIIAASKAPAAIVKSLIGGYGVDRAEKKEDPFANPYVTNGLMSMFDGEWNVGLGKHDDSSPVWKDLAYNHELTIDNGGSFKAQCLHCDGTARGAYGSNVPGNAPITIEAVIDRSILDTNWTIIWHQSSWYLSNNTTRSIVQCRRDGLCLLARYGQVYIGEGKMSIHMTYDGLYLVDFRINNEGVSFTQTGTSWFTRDGGYYFVFGGVSSTSNKYAAPVDIYNFRMYSKSLTDDQIAHNYAVDAERFSLT